MPRGIFERRRTPLAERFWARVSKTDGCWLWVGASRTTFGYGVISRGGRRSQIGAHRASWEIHFGPIPDGMSVLHRCDNPPCVRPDHLFLGTQSDNIRDMARKARLGGQCSSEGTKGERNGNARLTEQQVAEIRALGGTMSQQRIADRFGITQAHVSSILLRQRWT